MNSAQTALIEDVARKMHDRPWPGGHKAEWDDEPEGVQNRYRSMAYAAWPLIVDFFADWIERYEPGDARGIVIALELRKKMES